jgi:hypothetical protein
MSQYKIQKVGQEDTSPAPPSPSKAGRKKSMRTFPRGILRTTVKGVRDPAKAPPIRKSAMRGTLRIMTERGIEKRRKHIKKTVRNMPDRRVRDELKKAGMAVSEKTPAHIAKEILEGGMEAGMIVVK